jgi:hypothetical protein
VTKNLTEPHDFGHIEVRASAAAALSEVVERDVRAGERVEVEIL